MWVVGQSSEHPRTLSGLKLVGWQKILDGRTESWTAAQDLWAGVGWMRLPAGMDAAAAVEYLVEKIHGGR